MSLPEAQKKGILYICATPIGNLQDITLRALQTLKTVDFIASEDTRETKKLLNFYQIKNRTISFHKYNQKKKIPEIVRLLKEGKRIALVSDAGTPGISDPGEDLINLAIKEEIEITVIPGPVALISSLVVSGLPIIPFSFFGFLPSRPTKRRKYLRKLKDREETLVFYEAPHRIMDTLSDLEEIFKEGDICIVRELTKRFEEVIRGKISEIKDKILKDKLRGEFTIIVRCKNKVPLSSNLPEEKIKKEVENLIKMGYTKKEAIKKMSQELNVAKRKIYKIMIKEEICLNNVEQKFLNRRKVE